MFVTDIILPYSPVKHQASTASCWAFSLCSYWETETAVKSGLLSSPNELSPWFLARKKIERLCEHTMRNPLFPFRRLPVGAQGQTAIAIVRSSGWVALSDYSISQQAQRQNYRKMMRIVQFLVWMGQLTIVFRTPILSLIRKVIDHYWCKLPDLSLIQKDSLPEILFYTSFSHLSFGHSVVLPVPDNFEGWTFKNIPMDDLIEKMKNALQNHHTLVWQGHIGRGFSMKKGVAMLPETLAVTDEMRSKQFLEGMITDDHMMHIIGMAHDEQGHLYFIAKNSVGDLGPYHGLIYIEEQYIRLNTVAIGL